MGAGIKQFCNMPDMPLIFLTGAWFAWHRQRIIREEFKTQRSKSNPEAQSVVTKRTQSEQHTSVLMDKTASESHQTNRKVKNTMVTPLSSICPPK